MKRETHLECLRRPMPTWQAAFIFYSALIVLGLLVYIGIDGHERFRVLAEIVISMGLLALSEARYNEIHGRAHMHYRIRYRVDDPERFTEITRMLCVTGGLFCAIGFAMEAYSLYALSI